MRSLLPLLLCLTTAAQTAKRPLSHKDYDSWRTITTPQLSRDGRWLAYGFMPQDGDGELVIRNLVTNKETRHPAGALPPPPVIPAAEVNPEAEPPRLSLTIRFTSDNQFVVANYFPAKAEANGQSGVTIVKLADSSATRVAGVRDFQVPSKGGAWLAMHKESKTAAPSAAPAENDGQDQRRGGGRSGSAARTVGADLILRDLTTGSERNFADVTEYSFPRDGKLLVYAVNAKQEDQSGLFAFVPGGAEPQSILAGKGKYAKLAWDREQKQLAFVSSKGAADKFAAYHWTRQGEAKLVIPAQESGLRIVDRGTLGFSRDGRKLYAAAGLPTRDAKTASEKVQMDLWHWRDDLIQPMQKVRANQERARTFRGVYHIAENKYVQVADDTLAEVQLSDDGQQAIGSDNRAYRRLIDYDGNYADYYWTDTATGQRKLIAKRLRASFGGGGGASGGPMQWSPDGRHALYFSQGHWQLLRTSDLATRNLTEALDVKFSDELDDTPDPAPTYGGAGWTEDSQSAIVYDRYDIWQVFADAATPARNLTAGRGRREKMQFRVQRMEPLDADDETRGLDLGKPLTLRAVNEETRETGFFRFTGNAQFQQLLWGAKNYNVVARAQEADVALVTASRFDEFPDLHVTSSSLATPRKVTNGGAQKAGLRWGNAETIRFRNTDGVALKATLIKPEGFDPARKYPLLIYIYERLSQNLHTFYNPQPGTSINFPYYASNGYLILMPDIVYTRGYPGQSALKCVLPALDAVVEKGFVNEKAVGIQGHSWGGYQIAYMLTQTNRFKAAEAGAPVGNMTSAYSGIRWGSGLPRQFQYEQTQSRIGATPFQNPQRFIENSPVFYAERVQTPLLMLHNDNDDAVPWQQGIELYLALRRNEKEAYMLNYNGEFHGLRRRHNQKDWTLRLQQFFDHHLKDAMKPDWMQKGVAYVDREEEKERFRKAAEDK